MRKLFLILAVGLGGAAPLAAQNPVRPRTAVVHHTATKPLLTHRAAVRRIAARRHVTLQRARKIVARRRARRPGR